MVKPTRLRGKKTRSNWRERRYKEQYAHNDNELCDTGGGRTKCRYMFCLRDTKLGENPLIRPEERGPNPSQYGVYGKYQPEHKGLFLDWPPHQFSMIILTIPPPSQYLRRRESFTGSQLPSARNLDWVVSRVPMDQRYGLSHLHVPTFNMC